MGFAAAIPAILSTFGGVIGAAATQNDRNSAFQKAHDAYNQLTQIGLPPDMAKAVILQQYQSVGQLTPELQQYINAGPSQVAGMQENPAMKNAQLMALAQMQQRANGGMQPQDYAAYIQAQQQIAGEGQAKQNQILQEMASRGLEGRGNSGAELAARLSGAQNANNQQMNAGLNIAGQASQNALNAIAQSANMAGQVRNTDFNQALQKAQAADAFNKFNTQNQLGIQQANNNLTNEMNSYNFQNQQNIANQNTAMNNAERYRELQGQLQNWQNQQQYNNILANADLGQSGVYNSQADLTGKQIAGIFGGASQGAAGMIGGMQQNSALNDLIQSLKKNGQSSSSSDSSGDGGYYPNGANGWGTYGS